MIKTLWWGYQWASSSCGNILSMEQTLINSKKINATQFSTKIYMLFNDA
jgi:hypothetical protein